MKDCPFVVCIVGPTASGKSALAEEVAKNLHSSVVSVDAMQVYKGMDIGTAKVPEHERAVPLLMVDKVDPTQEYSVQLFQKDARFEIDALLAAKKIPILCGGTGLYLDAVIDQMHFPSGTVGSKSRLLYEQRAKTDGPAALYQLLCDRDPQSAELIHPHNVRRVVRALEMLDEGVSYAKHHRGLKGHLPYYHALIWGLTMDRKRLYARIDERVERMFSMGLIDEVRRLKSQGFEENSTAGQAIGYREVLLYLSGELPQEEAVEAVKQHTRHYAKRQLSWLKRDGRVRWLDMDTMGIEQATKAILSEIEKGCHESI